MPHEPSSQTGSPIRPSFHLIDAAPVPVAPWSHCVKVGPWHFLSGQIPNLPGDEEAPLPDGVSAQTTQCLDNLRLILEGMGLGLEHVVQTRVYLLDFQRDYAPMNAVWERVFPAGHRPARTTVGVTGLARDALIEIDAVAFLAGK